MSRKRSKSTQEIVNHLNELLSLENMLVSVSSEGPNNTYKREMQQMREINDNS